MGATLDTAAYDALLASARDQLRIKIAAKRILSITYHHDKKTRCAQVGLPHPEFTKFKVVAIFEANPYIVMTQSATGQPGLTVMVTPTEITDVMEFASV